MGGGLKGSDNMKRFIMHSDLKPEKVDEYIKLHANPWPEIMELII